MSATTRTKFSASELAEFGIDDAPVNGDGHDAIDGGEAQPAIPLATMAETGLVLTRMDGVERKDVEWLWPSRLAMGKLNMFFGDPESGKSTLAAFVIATISKGGQWPDGSGVAKIADTLVLILEDGLADTFGPRLDAADADSSKVFAMGMVKYLNAEGKLSEKAFTLDMVPLVRDRLASNPNIKLIIIDPPASCMPDKVNENSNSQVRKMLAPWVKLAEETGVCVLFILHRPKLGTAKAIHGALGSTAWQALIRSALMVAKDKDDPNRRLLLRSKCNIAAPVPNLAFHIEGPIAHAVFDGDTTVTADDVARSEVDPGRPGPEPKKLEAATEWIAAELADYQPVAVETLKKNAKAASISWRTIQRAAREVGVKYERCQFGGEYTWRLPKP